MPNHRGFVSRIAGLLAGFAFILTLAPATQAQSADLDYTGLEAEPAIWRISDTDSEIYIFGTFHLLPPELKWETDTMSDIIASIDALYLEAEVHSPESQARVQALAGQLAMNAPGVTLSSMLDDETNARLAEIAPTLGMAPAMLEPFRPWYAQLALAVVQMQRLGFDPQMGVEMSLLRALESREIDHGYFETAEQQIRFLSDMPDALQAEAMSEGLRQMEAMPAMLDGMVRAWALGDMPALDTMINETMRDESPEVYDVLIVRRNRNWIPQIEAVLAGEGVVLIAVGAAHLPGENGVIALLDEAGIEAERVQ